MDSGQGAIIYLKVKFALISEMILKKKEMTNTLCALFFHSVVFTSSFYIKAKMCTMGQVLIKNSEFYLTNKVYLTSLQPGSHK